MLFTQPIFLVFFAGVFIVTWVERSNARRKLWLLLASYVFYAGWDWRFLGLIATTTVVDFMAARGIERTLSTGARRRWLAFSLAVNLSILGFFKYFGFFVESASALLHPLGFSVPDRALAIVLPVGISFFTFQSLSYTIDVYRGKLQPVTSLRDYALFVSFFPQLVAGPIVRAASFLPQLARRPEFGSIEFRRLVWLVLAGYVKKACIADRLSTVVDPVFADPSSVTTFDAWVATLSYAAQIYCDFSGYTDIAIGCAGLLGYRLTRNFDSPYLARSIRDFWRRWHISLSTWLRDYLYVSLGGNRGSRLLTYRNLMLTMLLGGLWHGAAWTFVIWGGLHGLWLVAQREWELRLSDRIAIGRARRAVGLPSALAGVAAWAATLFAVCLGWIFFRATTVEGAFSISTAFLGPRTGGSSITEVVVLSVPILLFGLHALAASGATERLRDRFPDWAFALFYGAAAALALAFSPHAAEPFIYFQF
jgi:alginate O-acetyltransferase complex protein AlgI